MAWSKDRPMPDYVRAKLSAALKGGGPLYKHGMSQTPFYEKWEAAKKRCDNPNDPRYKDYGGRGIKMLWHNFKSYKDDMYESYLKFESLHGNGMATLDRIDNNGNYCKENCRWATRKQQQRNMRNNITYTLSEIIEALGLGDSMVRARLKRGSTLAEALRPRSYCGSCDGKGYATVNDAWHGHDTDTDIGSPGGYVAGGNRNAMKFCKCERGRQLKAMVEAKVAEAEIRAQLKALRGLPGKAPYVDHDGMMITVEEKRIILLAHTDAWRNNPNLTSTNSGHKTTKMTPITFMTKHTNSLTT